MSNENKSNGATYEEIVASLNSWTRCEHYKYPIDCLSSHKYEVKAVTTRALDGSKVDVRTYYVSSIKQLIQSFHMGYSFFRRVNSEFYETVKGDFVTAHYVTRIY